MPQVVNMLIFATLIIFPNNSRAYPLPERYQIRIQLKRSSEFGFPALSLLPFLHLPEGLIAVLGADPCKLCLLLKSPFCDKSKIPAPPLHALEALMAKFQHAPYSLEGHEEARATLGMTAQQIKGERPQK